MRTLHVFAFVSLLIGSAGSAAAQPSVTLDFQNGRVKLAAQNMPVSQILAEWARRGRTTIVNGERVPGPPVTLELNDVPEQQALDILLRSASGYLVAARETAITGASTFDRIFILPTSSRPTGGSTPPPPPQVAQRDEDFDDDLPPQAPRVPGPQNPGARLPRDIVAEPGFNGRPPLDPQTEPEPENRPTPTPGNPFGVQPGTNRPGVITPPTPPATRPVNP